jgi:AcrR family transcriptional regulator
MIAEVQELPVFDSNAQPRERADAARNRLRILEAAATLVGERGIEKVSMEDVACAAGVGTGTLYRRFRDRAGLALALLDEETREFQNDLISGAAPLGPGAPATERLQAFGTGYLHLLERHADLILAAGRSEFDGRGPYQLYATHVAILLREAAPQLDAEACARSLMATLAPSEFTFVRFGLGWPLERVIGAWCEFVAALTGPGTR